MQMSIPIDRGSRDASKYMVVFKFWSGRSNIFGKYSFCEFVPMEETDFLITAGLIMMFVEKEHIRIDRTRWVLPGTQQRIGGTPGGTNCIFKNSNRLPTSLTWFQHIIWDHFVQSIIYVRTLINIWMKILFVWKCKKPHSHK